MTQRDMGQNQRGVWNWNNVSTNKITCAYILFLPFCRWQANVTENQQIEAFSFCFLLDLVLFTRNWTWKRKGPRRLGAYIWGRRVWGHEDTWEGPHTILGETGEPQLRNEVERVGRRSQNFKHFVRIISVLFSPFTWFKCVSLWLWRERKEKWNPRIQVCGNVILIFVG